MAKIKKMYDVSVDGSERTLVYPATIVQGIHDGRTGASLEAILAQYNSYFLQYQGSPMLTRCLLPTELRRPGVIITYKTLDGVVSERSMTDSKTDELWGNDTNWSRIDELSLSGKLSVSANGTWVIEGVDSGIAAVGPKGENGISPLLRMSGNKLQQSYDGNVWTDLSGEFADNLFIKGYVATYAELPSSAVQGDIWGVGPTYAADDAAQTNPRYRYYVRNAGGWVDNGEFTSIVAGIVQETGDGEGVVMSQKAVTEKFTELESNIGQKDISLELELIQSNAFISNDGIVTSNANYSIKKASLKAGMSILISEDSSQYVAVFSELVNGAYKVISVGTQPKVYLAKEDKDIYISVANTHTINFSISDVAESAFNSNVAASQSQEILQTESWRLADEIIVAENSLIDTGGGLIANSGYDVCQVMIKKGDKVRITASISSYLAVFAKKIRGERRVLLVGSGNKTYEYVADYSGILVYTKPKASEGLYILRSPISEVAYVGNPLYGKKILCLGDSITEFKYDGMGYPDWIRLKTGADVYCCGIGGTRISARQAMVDAPSTSVEAYAALDIVNIVGALCSGNWSKQIAAAEWLKNNTADDNTAIVQMLSTLNIKSFDYITILAGTNDWTANYAFGDSNPFGKNAPYYVNSAINKIAYDLSSNAPLAKLVAFTPLVRYADQRVDSQWSDVAKNRNRTLADFSLKLIKEWRANHIPCGDLYFGLGWNKYNFPAFFRADDNVHPFLGFEQIADKIIGYLNSDLSNDNELAYLFAQREAIYSVLGMTGIYEYPEATIVAENSMIDAYGGVSASNGWTIKSISVTKGDVVRLNQGTSVYVSVFAKKNGDKYTPLVVGKGGLIFYEYVADYDGDLYYSLPDGYDDISVVHSDFLAK